MSDLQLALEIVRQITSSVDRILHRFESVPSSSFFLDSEEGLEKLDSICMQLIAIGESLKNLDKVAGVQFLQGYPQVNWKNAKGMRDVISHHYFDLNAEAVFEVCEEDLPPMLPVLKQMVSDLNA